MEASFCSCYYDDYEPVECFSETTPTARKDHKCCECGELIKKGEKYHRMKYLCDGQWWNTKVCILCERIRNDYCAPYGELRETVMEAMDFDYVTGELSYSARKQEEEEQNKKIINKNDYGVENG